MDNATQCDVLLMRYVPDPFRNEFVNIGVLLLGREDQFADVRFTHDWARVRCADPQADVDILEALESDIRQQLQSGAESRKQIVYRLQDTLSNALQLSQPSALLSQSPAQDLERLAQIYLERAKPRREPRLGARQRIVSEMRNAFETAGVWESLNKKIKVAKYTHSGDPMKIDCGYRPNGIIRLFHAVSLASEPDSAKVLAFSYPALAEGIARVEHAKTDLTAIVEDGLIQEDDGIQFAMQTLQQASIHVVPVSQLSVVAELARKELRL